MSSALGIAASNIFSAAVERKASYVYLVIGSYPTLRIDDKLVELSGERIINDQFLIDFIVALLDERQQRQLTNFSSVSLVKEFVGQFRFRVNIFYKNELLTAELKMIPSKVPELSELGLAPAVEALANRKRGLIIIAGGHGSGKTTTVAAIIDRINKTRRETIVSIEKPIEYLFFNDKSSVEQREVGRDVHSVMGALEHSQRFSVDIVSVGESLEPTALLKVIEMAKAGKLVILQMTTESVVKTIEYIWSELDLENDEKARLLLAESLVSIVCQKLIPRTEGGLIPATEIMVINDAIRSLLKIGRIRQIDTTIQGSRAEGMTTLDQSLAELVYSNEILFDEALENADDPVLLRQIVEK